MLFGGDFVIEIYLFVNPLGPVCLQAEMRLLEFFGETDKKIQFRVLPLVNMNTIADIMERRGIAKNAIDVRNRLFEDTYAAALDCKAAQLQGKKRGREFLMRLQEIVGCDKVPYSKKLAEEVLVEIGGDLAMFREDRDSALVKELFQTDQKIAHEMGINRHPSAVVYNYACERDYGVLLEGTKAMMDIPELCRTTDENYHIFHIEGYLKRQNERRVQHAPRHLKLM